MELLEKINSLDVSDNWKSKFRTLAEIGQPITYSMMLRKETVYKQLPFSIKFNIWAFMFGLIYYLAKGMWKKGLMIFAIGIAIAIVVTILFGEKAGNIASIIAPAGLFASFASFDYYRTMVLGEDFWF